MKQEEKVNIEELNAKVDALSLYCKNQAQYLNKSIEQLSRKLDEIENKLSMLIGLKKL